MLSEDQHKKLKIYAKKEGRTLGNLVREALDAAYKKKDLLEHRKQVAVSAYEEGFISLGKLSEVLGIDPISTRIYLKERGIALLTPDLKETAKDAENA